ncbi:interleukin-18 receptor accessory protein [Apodemus sylvaticus]|uniref:interleukin-18 receptor accessory protein n=1 Tax=Apodemus sylvaticus TaxID=10129 RepID=UPI002244E9CD|nr:interleukin-18 receptor accessory protein [Apodemus sylvaticus]XP_052049131.1 interleukin-18 receptor accessory protein [Apodemus sylvaticus]
MLCLGWVFLWFFSGEKTTAFNHSACATRKLLWTYSARGAENFVLFCDLQELQKQKFSHISQVSTTQGPARKPCSGSQKDLSDVQWYMQSRSGGPLEEISRNSPHMQNKGMLRILAPQMNSIRSYICRPRIRSPQDMACCIKTVLEVKSQRNVSCGNSAQDEQVLLLGSIGSIHCPSLTCQSEVQSPEMTWYKDGRLLSEYKKNPIEVEDTYDFHQGLYVCDYTQSDNMSSWTVRAVVQVRTIDKDINVRPDILDPITDTLDVELGKPLTLPCRVQFGFQRFSKPVIKWYVKESTQEWEMPVFEEKRIQSTFKNEVIERTIFLREVTQRDLSRKFVCFAQNSIGNTTRTIQLRKKEGAVLVYLLLGTALMLVGILVAAALLYWHWIEVVLLCRSYKSKDETLRDKKEFDAFVSYADWSSPETEARGSLSEEHLALNLFPEVLENTYGYSLCLLERDVTPGGVYADDIVHIIKKSRRGIFILSPRYISGPRVFELQAAVNLALVDQTLKLILIKFCSFQEPESLPYLVKKALRVLPTVTWKGLKSVPASSRFWTQIRYHMPVKNSNRFMFNWLRIIPKGFSPEKDLVRQKALGGTRNSGNSHGAQNRTQDERDCKGAQNLLLSSHQKRC